MKPLVSVCVPVHNNAGYVKWVVKALLRQTYPNLEVVVSDNGSTDGSGEVAAAEAGGDPRVTVCRLEHTVSQNESWRYAYRSARGEYVNLHRSQDQSLPPEFVEKMMVPLLADPSLDFSVCHMRVIADDVSTLNSAACLDGAHHAIEEFSKHALTITDRRERAKLLLRHCLENRVGTPYAAVVKREALPWAHWKKTDYYWPESYSDWTFMTLLFLNHTGAWVSDVKMDYHVGPDNGNHQVISGCNARATLVDRMYRLMMPVTVLADPEFHDLRVELSDQDVNALADVVVRRLMEAVGVCDHLIKSEAKP